ncbi:hypothetical protein AIIKEEIJ_02696 [Rhodococcus sp. YH1]|nr:hypothetical protein [Rhodococcus sp. YH1]
MRHLGQAVSPFRWSRRSLLVLSRHGLMWLAGNRRGLRPPLITLPMPQNMHRLPWLVSTALANRCLPIRTVEVSKRCVISTGTSCRPRVHFSTIPSSSRSTAAVCRGREGAGLESRLDARCCRTDCGRRARGTQRQDNLVLDEVHLPLSSTCSARSRTGTSPAADTRLCSSNTPDPAVKVSDDCTESASTYTGSRDIENLDSLTTGSAFVVHTPSRPARSPRIRPQRCREAGTGSPHRTGSASPLRVSLQFN